MIPIAVSSAAIGSRYGSGVRDGEARDRVGDEVERDEEGGIESDAVEISAWRAM